MLVVVVVLVVLVLVLVVFMRNKQAREYPCSVLFVIDNMGP